MVWTEQEITEYKKRRRNTPLSDKWGFLDTVYRNAWGCENHEERIRYLSEEVLGGFFSNGYQDLQVNGRNLSGIERLLDMEKMFLHTFLETAEDLTLKVLKKPGSCIQRKLESFPGVYSFFRLRGPDVSVDGGFGTIVHPKGYSILVPSSVEALRNTGEWEAYPVVLHDPEAEIPLRIIGAYGHCGRYYREDPVFADNARAFGLTEGSTENLKLFPQ